MTDAESVEDRGLGEPGTSARGQVRPRLDRTCAETTSGGAASERARPAPALLALATGAFAIGVTEFVSMSLLPGIARELQVGAPTAGHLVSAYALGVVVGAPVLAAGATKLPRRALLLMLVALVALSNALSSLAPNYGCLLAFRFVAGLPHGAYFGTASLVAASLVPAGRRNWAVSRVFLGLTVATVVGVPLANWVGQILGWRWGFALVTLCALLAMAMILAFAPKSAGDPQASPLRELDALRERQVWLTLAIGAIGFGGLFAVYTYLTSTLSAVTGAGPAATSLILSLFGLGLTVGNLVVPIAADRRPMLTAAGLLVWSALVTALYPLAANEVWTMGLDVFAIGCGGALATVLQTRLMDVAGRAQALAAALNHSAFNTANAVGPWLAGMVIAAGLGWTATGLVGAGLALCGLAIWGCSYALEAREPSAG